MAPVGQTSIPPVPTAPLVAPINVDPSAQAQPTAESHTESELLQDDSRSLVMVYGPGRSDTGTSELKGRATKATLVNPPEAIAMKALETLVEATRIDRAHSLIKTEDMLKEVSAQLRKTYTANAFISLWILEEHKKILIEKLYVHLAIIGEYEEKEKKAEAKRASISLGQEIDEITHTHEAIFEPKRAIKPEELLSDERLKNPSQSKRVLIQGSAGIGKTTFCHYIAYQWAKGTFFQEFKYVFWLPVRKLNEKEYPPSSEPLLEEKFPFYLPRYLSKECGVRFDYIQSYLTSEGLRDQTLIILDGYDELSPEAASEGGYLHSTLDHLKSFPHVFITTRPQPVDFDPVRRLEILGFDARGIQEYVGKFFSGDKEKEQELNRYLHQPLIRSLAHIPINLEIFCSLIAEGKSLFASEFPTMVGLYIQLTDWLFKRFRIHSTQLNNPIEEVKEESDPRHAQDVEPLAEALEEIAWKAMEQNTLYLKEGMITEILRTAKKIRLGDIRRIGPLRIENGEGVFIHLTFQEFFAGARFAHLYENNHEEAKKQLEMIKFKPQFQLVLPMAIGYLSQRSEVSHQAKVGLKLFFDDLFSEPRDLGISYETRLLARCFEECIDPSSIPQYENFIDRVVEYLSKHPVKKLKVECLRGNYRLLSHAKVIKFLEKTLQDPAKQHNPKAILSELAQLGQIFPPSILLILSELLTSTQESWVIEILENIVENGNSLPPEVAPMLIKVIENPQVGENVKSSATKALGEVAKGGASLPQGVTPMLLKIIENPQPGEDIIKSSAAMTLGEIVKSGDPSAEQVVLGLISILDLFTTGNNFFLMSVVISLRGIVKNGGALAERAVLELIERLKKLEGKGCLRVFGPYVLEAAAQTVGSSADLALSELKMLLEQSNERDLKASAIRALGGVAKGGGFLAEQAFSVLTTMFEKLEEEDDLKLSIACVLSQATKNESFLAEKVRSVLIKVFEKPEATYEAQSSAAVALVEMVKNGDSLAEQALLALFGNVNADSDVRISLAETLLKIGKHEGPLAEKALKVLIYVLEHPGIGIRPHNAHVVLGEMAKMRNPLAEKALFALIRVLIALEGTNALKMDVTKALKEALESGTILPAQALSDLSLALENSQLKSKVKCYVAYILEKGAKNETILTAKALSDLSLAFDDPSIGDEGKSYAALALGEIAKKGGPLSDQAIAALIIILEKFEVHEYIEHAVVLTLREVARSGNLLAEKALSTLINVLDKPAAEGYVKSIVAEALEVIVKNGQFFPDEAQQLAQLCFVTGHALFYRNGQFYSSNRSENNPLQIKLGVKRMTFEESYNELLVKLEEVRESRIRKRIYQENLS